MSKESSFVLHNDTVRPVLKRIFLLAGLFGILSGCGGGGGGPGGGPGRGGDNNPPTDGFIATLSGTVGSSAGSVADSDVNDPNALYVANDTPDQAQSIPNPVMLGGYVNVANTGDTGRSSSSGDRVDFFRISLAANQIITLDIANHDTGDLDLYLYKDDGNIDLGNPFDVSQGTDKTESLVVSEAGDYIIAVFAHDDTANPNDGYSSYALVVGLNVQGGRSHTTSRLVLTDDFVPGDVIVRFKDDPLALNARQSLATRATSLGMRAKAGDNGRAMLLELEDLQNRQASFRALGIGLRQIAGPMHQVHPADPEKQLKMDTLLTIKALRKRKDVLYAEPNYIHQIRQVPTDPLYKYQWHYPLINLPAAWDVSIGDANVIVAVIDTGVLLKHPDLLGQFSADGGYDFIKNDDQSGDGEPGIDNNPDDPGDKRPPTRNSSFHGTHVAGTIAAATHFGSGGQGVAGVAPGVKIMPLRVLGAGGGTGYDIMQAVLYAAGLGNDSGGVPAKKADVINLSLGGAPFSQEMQDVYTQARNAGVIIVAAAGNDGKNRNDYPASYDGVISVSAVDILSQLTNYSNYGSAIDVAAPGGDRTNRDINGDGRRDTVLSTIGDDSSGRIVLDIYFGYEGTSMASPHVAGVLALMKSIHSGLTPADVDSLLSSGKIVEDLGSTGRDDQFGHGLIDARKAVDEAQLLAGGGTTPDNPLLSVSPASLNFGSSETNLSLSAANSGKGALTITSVDVDAAWLTVTTDSVDANTQLGSYRVTVDRSGLAAGTHTANITITSSINAITVSIIQQVGEQGAGTGTGYHYILLVDATTGTSLLQQEGNAQNGSYSFQFNNVDFSKGQSYFIVAGTDLDNDGTICNAGEACGAYITQTQPKTIGANDDHSGLDFSSSFNTNLRNQGKAIATTPIGGLAVRRLPDKRTPLR
jgi:serine protease